MKEKLKLIVLIDDDEPTNYLNRKILNRIDCTEEIITFESGAKALHFLKNKQEGGKFPCPELIFLDINMPEMDGWEFMKLYADLPEEQKGRIIILMLSTSLNPDDHARAENMTYINSFVNKPLLENKLVEIFSTHFSDRF